MVTVMVLRSMKNRLRSSRPANKELSTELKKLLMRSNHGSCPSLGNTNPILLVCGISLLR